LSEHASPRDRGIEDRCAWAETDVPRLRGNQIGSVRTKRVEPSPRQRTRTGSRKIRPSSGKHGAGTTRAPVAVDPGIPVPPLVGTRATASEDELIAHCRTQIASYKKPRSVRFVDDLPRLFNGKVDQKMLRG
jgi:acyl-CoA synthetase (AMP-forming)/AMP-acid ligase II